jgi:hypothetical protein
MRKSLSARSKSWENSVAEWFQSSQVEIAGSSEGGQGNGDVCYGHLSVLKLKWSW